MNASLDDMNLVIELNKGNEKALDVLFAQFYQPLCYFASRIIKNKEETEDIVTDVFYKLWNKRQDFDSLYKVKGFLYVSTRNACLDQLRHRERSTSAHKDYTYLFTSEEEEGFAAEQVQAEVLRKIYEEIEKLPKQCRQVFELSVFEGLKSKDIAERMNITVSNVTSQKSRAVQLLKTAVLKRIVSLILWMH